MKDKIFKTVDELRPIDDTLFHKLVENKDFCEELLQNILNMPHLKLIEAIPQRSLRNVKGRSVILDSLCKDADSNYYNVEMQRGDEDDHQRRVRYNGSNIDTFITEKGISFSELPEIYVIYISEFDILKGGKTIYHIERIIRETNVVVQNGFHEIYVNAEIDDGSQLADLMTILQSSEVIYDRRFPKICQRIQYLKVGKGRINMCRTVENYAKEYAEEIVCQIIKNMLKNGFSVQSIQENTGVSIQQIKELAAEQIS